MTTEQKQTIATFDLETKEGQFRVFNAQNGAGQSMKNLASGTVITVTDVLQYADKTDEYGKEQDVNITVLFTKDDESERILEPGALAPT